LRGFPLYKQDDNLTNIPLDNFSYQGYETYEIPLSTKKISLEEASHKINEILKENILNFFHYNKISRLRVLFSAGIDTLTVWSLIENLNIEYDLYIHTPKSKDFFGTKQEYESDLVSLCKNKFWGYQMTSCFLEPNYYATGFYSERMQVREVSQGHIISNYKKQKLWELPNSKDYLYWFLQRPSNQINNEPTFETEEETLNSCNQSIFYDHQMWHIDNNFHISPFFDSRITEIINQLSLDDIIKNALDASIQKNIIKYNKSEFLQILSDYKNSQNIWTNYHKNFNKILLKSSINKFIT
jgi:hypothetical protein